MNNKDASSNKDTNTIDTPKKSFGDIMSTQITFSDIKNGYNKATSTIASYWSKVQFINTFMLKLIAIIVMTIDHTGHMLGIDYINGRNYLSDTFTYDQYIMLRTIGRIAFPIFCYLIVEGFFYTRNVWKYSGRLLVFALISQIPFNLMQTREIYTPGCNTNVFFTLFFGLLAVTVLDACIKAAKKAKENPDYVTFSNGRYYAVGIIFAVAMMLVAETLKTDYDSLGVIIILLFYIFRGKPVRLFISLYLAIYYLSTNLEMYALYAFIPILLHNKKKGPGLKYFFYVYYPLHITVLFLIWKFLL